MSYIIYDEKAEYRFGKFFKKLNDNKDFLPQYKFDLTEEGKPILLGSGGFSLVFRGSVDDKKIAKNVAIKVTFADTQNDNQRAVKEAERQHEISNKYNDGVIAVHATKSLAVNNYDVIWPLFELDTDKDMDLEMYHFIVMDEVKPIVKPYVSSEKRYELDDLLVQDVEKQVLKLAENLLTVLSECHKEGIFHRDIKPENIFYADENSSYKLGDFGISSEKDDLIDAGTKMYMAPEIKANYKKYSEKSDVYSLGYTLLVILNYGSVKSPNDIIDNLLKSKVRNKEIINICLKMCNEKENDRIGINEAKEEFEKIQTSVNASKMSMGDRLKLVDDISRNIEVEKGHSCTNKELYKIIYKKNLLLTEKEIKEFKESVDSDTEISFKLACYYDFVSTIPEDKSRAGKLYLKSAELGNSLARVFYANSILQKKERQYKDEAVKQLLQSIIAGNSWGYVALGDAIRFDDIFQHTTVEGLGERKIGIDIYDIFECYNRAIEIDENNTYSIYKIAKLFHDVDLLEESYKYCVYAVEKGDAMAMNLLGEMYLTDGEKKHNIIKERKYKPCELFMEASNKGCAEAEYNLGNMYYTGKGVNWSISKAIEWYSAAANHGHVEAQYTLGNIYELMEGKEKEAFKWYSAAADQGYAKAQNSLGVMFDKGEVVHKDLKMAITYYEKAAKQNNAQAQYNLGLMYLMGTGVKKDLGQARMWFEEAAKQNNAQAQYNLGLMYHKGYGVDENKSTAIEYYKKAADQNVAQAQFNLGVLYEEDDRVQEAFELYKKAAEQGHAKAQNNLGVMYKKGRGVAKDLKNAFEYYKKAAKQGLPEAQYNLVVMYEEGRGIDQNLEEAFKW